MGCCFVVYGVGLDTTSIKRIAKSMENRYFLKRCFSVEELLLFGDKKYAPKTVAGNFAAKEAFCKSLGIGIFAFDLKEVSVLRDGRGAPYLEFDGAVLEMIEAKNLSFKISITHEREYAHAICIATKQQ